MVNVLYVANHRNGFGVILGYALDSLKHGFAVTVQAVSGELWFCFHLVSSVNTI